MYQIDRNRELNAELITDAIDFNEKRRDRFNRLYDYYCGKQDILNREKFGEALSNNKLMVNHARYIVDVGTGYLLGNPVSYQADEGEDIQPVIDQYKRQAIDNLDSKLAKDVAIFGIGYEYIYADEDSNPCSVALDVRNTIIIYDNSMVHDKLYGVNYRPIYKNPEDSAPEYYEVVVASKDKIQTFKLRGKVTLELLSEQPNSFGEVPFVEYLNNDEALGDFETVISLIDAYNLIQSDRVNDREQLVDAILCFKGMSFDAEQMEKLRTHRALAGIPADGDVFYLTKNISEADNDVLRQNLEKDIHKISMVPNMSDENFVGNASGVALKYKLLTFEQNTKNKERYFEKGLKERFAMYTHFLSLKSQMQEIPIEDVDAIFVRNLPANDYETSQMINNLVGTVDKKLLVSQLSFVQDAEETVELAEEESNNQTKDNEYAAGDFADANATDGVVEPMDDTQLSALDGE